MSEGTSHCFVSNVKPPRKALRFLGPGIPLTAAVPRASLRGPEATQPPYLLASHRNNAVSVYLAQLLTVLAPAAQIIKISLSTMPGEISPFREAHSARDVTHRRNLKNEINGHNTGSEVRVRGTEPEALVRWGEGTGRQQANNLCAYRHHPGTQTIEW